MRRQTVAATRNAQRATRNERELDLLRLAALDKLGRKEEAQAERRRLFDRWLDEGMLRAWLRALPAFENFEAEQQALDTVLNHKDASRALAFLIRWPDTKRAGCLVRDRHGQLEPRAYNILRPAAEALSATDPTAATILYRRLVAGVLDRGTSKYYPYASRDYQAAGAMASGIANDAAIIGYQDWLSEIRRLHGRKTGFWSLVDGKQSR